MKSARSCRQFPAHAVGISGRCQDAWRRDREDAQLPRLSSIPARHVTLAIGICPLDEIVMAGPPL